MLDLNGVKTKQSDNNNNNNIGTIIKVYSYITSKSLKKPTKMRKIICYLINPPPP